MLGLLCTRTPKPWILYSLSSSSAFHHHYYCGLSSAPASNSYVYHRFSGNSIGNLDDRRHKTSFHAAADIGGVKADEAAVSVWHAILPAASGSGDWRRDCLIPTAGVVHHPRQRGEGSWNVAWDARPARWIHRLDLTCLLFGVCSFLGPVDWNNFLKSQDSELEAPAVLVEDQKEVLGSEPDIGGVIADGRERCNENSSDYRVTGVMADGRCLFRAIAHGACLQSGTEAPDENRQTELADELRAQVVTELLKRRKETEWFIEGDFDAYVKRLQQPYVWGGEPELLMASHVLKTPITVYMKDRSSGELAKIANYGEDYEEVKEFPINVLFHGYGHYDLLETSSNQSCEKANI
ncbi:hypothetical protein V2J09_001261 [Rumex salicifolius]